jgi:hypothetical protein
VVRVAIWLVERLIISTSGMRLYLRRFSRTVEHHHRVVDRIARQQQQRGHGVDVEIDMQ